MNNSPWDPLSEMTTLRDRLDKILDEAFPERIQAKVFLAPEWPHSSDIQSAEKGSELMTAGSLDSEKTGTAK
jgi:hypothetical protein